MPQRPSNNGFSCEKKQLRKVVDFSLAGWKEVATHILFTVDGGFITEARLFARTVATITTGGAPTIEAGVLSDTDTFFAADQHTDRGATAGAIWLAAGAESLEPLMSALPAEQATSEDIVYKIVSAALTGGSVEFVLEFVPHGDVRVKVGTGAAP